MLFHVDHFKQVLAIGWGTLSESGSLPTYLQQVTVQTIAYNADTCTPTLSDWHVQLCAGVSSGGKGYFSCLNLSLTFLSSDRYMPG